MTVFPRIEYAEWIRGRPEAALFDLGTSALRGDRTSGGPIPEPLAERADPPPGVTLETLLATVYGVEPEQVLVTAGATHADFLAAAAAVTDAEESGAETTRVLVEKPCHEPLVRTPEALGAAVDRFRRGDESRLDPDRIEGAVRENTCLVAATNRHNPTGVLADRETLAAAAAATREAGARLLVDEVYAPYVTEAREGDGTAFGGPTAAGLDGTVITGSVSKFLGFPGLRIGWLIADPGFVATARRVLAHVPAVAEPTTALAARAIYHRDELAPISRDLLRANAAALGEFVANGPLDGHAPAGSSFAFLDAPEGTAARASEAGVLVVPGRFFGDDSRVRVALGRATEDVRAGLRTLVDALA